MYVESVINVYTFAETKTHLAMKKQIVNIRISAELKEQIKAEAQKRGVSLSAYILMCVNYCEKFAVSKNQLTIF